MSVHWSTLRVKLHSQTVSHSTLSANFYRSCVYKRVTIVNDVANGERSSCKQYRGDDGGQESFFPEERPEVTVEIQRDSGEARTRIGVSETIDNTRHEVSI